MKTVIFDQKLRFSVLLKISFSTFLHHAGMFLIYACVALLFELYFQKSLSLFTNIRTDTVWQIRLFLKEIFGYMIWIGLIESCLYAIDNDKRRWFIPLRISLIKYPWILWIAMQITSVLQAYTLPLLIGLMPFESFCLFLMIDRKISFPKAFKASFNFSILNLGPIIRTLLFCCITPIIVYGAGRLFFEKAHSFFLKNSSLHFITSRFFFFILFLLLFYLCLLVTYLYRILSAPYFDDMQSVEDIEDWSEGK